MLMFLQELHSSSHINEFLPVVELGFKSVQSEVKVAAFEAWQHLINNFSLNPGKWAERPIGCREVEATGLA